MHWSYLGLIFGLLTFVGLYIWMRLLNVGTPMFCWAIWAIMGQSLGAYVGPRTWFVFFVAAAGAALHQRGAPAVYAPRGPLEMQPAYVAARRSGDPRGRWQELPSQNPVGSQRVASRSSHLHRGRARPT